MQSQTDLQTAFFRELLEQFDSRADMVRAVGEDLGLRRDAVYRRLRGDSALTAQEFLHLTRKYQLSFLGAPEPSLDTREFPSMFLVPGDELSASPEVFLRHTEDMVQRFEDLEGVRLCYATPELPLFYEMATPLLRAFRFYVFRLTRGDYLSWEDRRFRPEALDPGFSIAHDKLLRRLYNYRTVEVWSVGILDFMLRQIEYVYQVGGFTGSEKHQLAVLDDLGRVVDHLEQMTLRGRRFPLGQEPNENSSPFEVYHNELSNTSRIMIFESRHKISVFGSLMNPHFLYSSDPRIVQQAQEWFRNLQRPASALSAQSLRYVNWFFRSLREKIASTRRRVG